MDGNELLMGGGTKSAKFSNLGDTVKGTITDTPRAEQMHKFDNTNQPTAELDFWPSGDPKMQVVVLLRTDQHDDPDDDGMRRLFISPRMQPAVRDAIKAVGAAGLEVGGRLAVRWVSGSGQGAGNPRLYVAEYSRPVMSADSMLGDDTPPARTVAVPAIQRPGPPATTVSTMLDDPAPAGVDPAVWRRMDETQRAAVRAAIAQTPPF